ncbi:MAG: hypothetical protein KAJ23_15830, partial [Maribacter sp.]|nr:hypothetical protein [Maribacter sp.]
KNYGKHFFQINLYTNKGHIRQFEQSRLPLSDQAIIYLPYRDKSNRTTKAELQTSTSTIKNDSLKFIKDWYITIDEKKYYYLRDKDRVWHYYDSTKKEVKLDIVAEYKKKHNVYNTLKNSGTHYIHKSKNEQMLLDVLFSDLGGMVFRMSRANRPKIKRPISPYAPYMKLVKNGQTVFKKPSELTDEDKKLIPPPPPADTVIIYNRLANTIKTLPRNRNANLNYLRKIHSEMNNAQKSKVEHPDSVLKSISQDGATKLQIKEYNTLAKKYNAMSKDDFRIIGKEVNRLKQVYGLMSDKQKKKAEPFPNFPPPPSSPKVTKQIKSNIPPPIPPIKPPTERTKYSDELLDAFDKLMEEGNLYGQAGIAYSKKGKGSIKDLQQKYKEVMKLYETYVKLAVKENLMRPTYSKPRKIRKGDRSNIPPPPPPSHVDGEIIEVPSSSAAPSILNGEIIEVPPSPPSPKSPEEHVMEMAKKDALFYFEGKKISSDKALEILKKSKKINLWTRHEGLKRPIVELSTESYFRPIPNN